MKITIENAKKVLIKYLGKNTEKVNHSIRVAEIAKKLAEKCGENVKEAVIAALLHDIGKSMNEQEMLNLCLRRETTLFSNLPTRFLIFLFSYLFCFFASILSAI